MKSKTVKFVPAFLKHFETFQQILRDRPVHVLVTFGNGGELLSDLNDYVGGFSFNCVSSLKVQAFLCFV